MGEEAKQAESKPEEKEEKAEDIKEEEKKEEEPKPPSPFVIYVDLHCVGCAQRIERCILKIRGVEGVVIDMMKNQITIKGIVEPQAVCNKIMKKTKRKAKVLSPLPEAEGQPLPQLVNSQVSGTTTVDLVVKMHCEACAQQLRKMILKMRGVQTAETELSTGKVTVTGTMDAQKLVEYVYRRTRKQARIVPPPEPKPKPKPELEKKEEEKPAEESKPPVEEEEPKKDEEKKDEPEAKEEEAKKEDEAENKEEAINIEEDNIKRLMHYYQPLYMIERIPPAPQLFSDENPNACSIS